MIRIKAFVFVFQNYVLKVWNTQRTMVGSTCYSNSCFIKLQVWFLRSKRQIENFHLWEMLLLMNFSVWHLHQNLAFPKVLVETIVLFCLFLNSSFRVTTGLTSSVKVSVENSILLGKNSSQFLSTWSLNQNLDCQALPEIANNIW